VISGWYAFVISSLQRLFCDIAAQWLVSFLESTRDGSPLTVMCRASKLRSAPGGEMRVLGLAVAGMVALSGISAYATEGAW
jgi:hypothetical protein